jgi:fructose-1,6-bisphosphatase/inositol monophosphatase family enzyme
MKLNPSQNALTCAIHAARAAGKIMRDNLRAEKKINETTQHDLKLELDVRCQKRIERILGASVPDAAILGEEGVAGVLTEFRWVIRYLIDGTVNRLRHPARMFHHAQTRVDSRFHASQWRRNYQTVLSVI